MVAYDLSHLTQADDEKVIGPIQDTEALFLYSVVRGMRMRRILEIGGLHGYSATNFIKAMPPDGVMYTVDIMPVTPVAPNHRVLLKDAMHLTKADTDGMPLDMVFFDCHDYTVQMTMYDRLVAEGVILDSTVIALHDTHVHPTNMCGWGYQILGGGWVHQKVERDMVNEFVRLGYHAFSLHTPLDRHNDSMPFRHGVTLMQKFTPLLT